MNILFCPPGHIPQRRTRTVIMPIDDASSDTGSKDGVRAKHNNLERDRGLERIPETDESTEESVEIGNGLEDMEANAVQALHGMGMGCDHYNVCNGAVSREVKVAPGREADFGLNGPLRVPDLRVKRKGDLNSYSKCHEPGICKTQNFANAAGIERHEAPIRIVNPVSTNFDIYGRGILGF